MMQDARRVEGVRVRAPKQPPLCGSCREFGVASGEARHRQADARKRASKPCSEENSMKKVLVLALVLAVSGIASAGVLIGAVDRSNGQSGDRAWIGVFDGNTDPIVGTLADGQYVFMDREYPWVNTPAQLAGAEYVLTFNTDKNGGETDVTYTVTLNVAAMVAITIDDRIPAEWNSDGAFATQQDAVDAVVAAFAAPGTFQDTGLDLFIREKADGSVDRQMSVYAAMLPAGVYTFGSQDSGKNFYSIGAIPEPASMLLLGLGGLALIRRRR